MKVVPKSIISSWNDKCQVDKMKHAHSLRKEVNPEKDLTRIKNRGRAPRPPPMRARSINPDKIRDILNQDIPMTCNQYGEYKDSIKKCSSSVIATCLGENESGTLKEKITTSDDIQKILTDKITDLPLLSSEWIVLGMTVAGKYLETKCGV